LKPQLSSEAIRARLENAPQRSDWPRALKLSPAAAALLESFARSEADPVRCAKQLSVPLVRPRPIEEAISSAGGIAWSELSENLMVRKLPGVFVAGEMIDWEAPTGGYLLQGCFSTGTRAGRAAANFP
ncbi:MAG: NAD(P)/FAD-dependent oxidoreductase, partial [Verrucomicrobiota bacterium]|nr:NAD(P)/FAD-dependent oxidoreductase [Verrucomicrobiota bacterium]